MSDDLISRKALLGTERLLMTDIVENNPTAKYILEQVLFDIEHAETAFDKEKVIDELQKPDPIIRTFIGKSFTTIDRAIEIVEKGGIE